MNQSTQNNQSSAERGNVFIYQETDQRLYLKILVPYLGNTYFGEATSESS